MTLQKLRTPKNLVIVLSICLLFSHCKKDITSLAGSSTSEITLSLPVTTYNYSHLTLPAYLSSPGILAQINISGGNTVTDNGATLGRVLFYEKNLSKTQTISCGSCHQQSNAFSDTIALSKGFAGGLTARNTMTLMNTAYYPDGKYFWDERANTLEIQVLAPVQNVVEMGMTLDSMVSRLQQLSYYPPLFTKAFGDPAITSDRVSMALAQFLRSIVSYQSKFDIGRQSLPTQAPPLDQVAFANFTAQENRGKQLFFSPQLANCAACHGTETFTAAKPQNNGLDLVSADQGVGGITGLPQQIGNFKVPSLKNIALTAPYMHDGRFTSLDQVVEHYSTGVQANRNLSGPLRNPDGSPRLLNLSADDKAALVAFLNTLTDTNITSDIKYSDPFVK